MNVPSQYRCGPPANGIASSVSVARWNQFQRDVLFVRSSPAKINPRHQVPQHPRHQNQHNKVRRMNRSILIPPGRKASWC